jgi:pilus assembly protein CpaC
MERLSRSEAHHRRRARAAASALVGLTAMLANPHAVEARADGPRATTTQPPIAFAPVPSLPPLPPERPMTAEPKAPAPTTRAMRPTPEPAHILNLAETGDAEVQRVQLGAPPFGPTPTPAPVQVPVPVPVPVPGGGESALVPPASNGPSRMMEVPPPVPPPPAPGIPSALPEAAANRPVGNDDLVEVAHEASATYTVVIGQSKVFQLGGEIRRVLVANPAIADVEVLNAADDAGPKLVNLFGRQFGTTTLTVFEGSGPNAASVEARTYKVLVTVDAPDLERRIGELYPGADVRVRQAGPQVILEGQVRDKKMMSDVLQLVTTVLRGEREAAVAAMTDTVPVQPAGAGMQMQQQVMNGPVAVDFSLMPGTIVNRVHVPGPRQVMLRVKIAELNRTAMRQIGVSWLDTRNNAILGSSVGGAGTVTGFSNNAQSSAFGPAGFLPGALSTPIPDRFRVPQFQPVTSTFNAAGLAAPGANSQLFGIFNAGEFNLFINALRANSLAKLLAEPNLVTLDGQPAKFVAGGQFPYPVAQSGVTGGGTAITIEFKEFGAILEVLPNIREGDVIQLDVSPVFSELNFGQSVALPNAGTVPSLNSRSARTVVEMREGQTLAIAGLLTTRTSAGTARVPILGDMPIVGALFSGNKIETVETELVVLVTPELIAPMEKDEVPPGPGERILEPNDYEFYFLGRLEGKTGKPHRATVHYLDPLEVMKHFRSEEYWVVGPHGHSD